MFQSILTDMAASSRLEIGEVSEGGGLCAGPMCIYVRTYYVIPITGGLNGLR